MAATGTPTTNIGLRRPQGTDPASVDDINYNSELIDTKLGAVGSTSVQEQINTLNSKTEYSGTKNDTYISAMEGRVVKYGKMVSGYFIITVNTNFSSNDLALISNLPPSYNGQIQLPCICLSGDDSWKAARVRVTTSGTITTWYGFSFKSGTAYLIPVNYVCS